MYSHIAGVVVTLRYRLCCSTHYSTMSHIPFLIINRGSTSIARAARNSRRSRSFLSSSTTTKPPDSNDSGGGRPRCGTAPDRTATSCVGTCDRSSRPGRSPAVMKPMNSCSFRPLSSTAGTRRTAAAAAAAAAGTGLREFIHGNSRSSIASDDSGGGGEMSVPAAAFDDVYFGVGVDHALTDGLGDGMNETGEMAFRLMPVSCSSVWCSK